MFKTIFNRKSKNNFETYLITSSKKAKKSKKFDTIICSGNEDSFNKYFLKENKWEHIRIEYKRLNKLKYIAIYITSPVQKITHYAKILEIKPSNTFKGKYNIKIDNPIMLKQNILLGNIHSATVRSNKYTLLSKLKCAKKYKDLY